MSIEEQNCCELEALLAPDFETFREAPLRHPLFRRRILRVDLLAVPRAPDLSAFRFWTN